MFSISLLIDKHKTAYENRLWKYRNHNFEVYWDELERFRVKKIDYDPSEQKQRELTGLAKLIFSEGVLETTKGYRSARERWKSRRSLRRIDDSKDPSMVAEESSGYADHITPYGERTTATEYVTPRPRSFLALRPQYTNRPQSVRRGVIHDARAPYMLGTIQDVTDPAKCKWRLKLKAKRKLTKEVTFIKHNPGQQMIGSFYPLTADDW